MFTLYSIGNTNTKILTTPEVRGDEVKKDKELKMALTLLPIAISKTNLEKLVSKGARRYRDMDRRYLRAVDLSDKQVKESIVSLSLHNSSLEKKWLEAHPKASVAKKHKYLKEQGLVDLTVDDVINPSKVLEKELEKVSGIVKKIVKKKGNIPSKCRGSLHMGMPWFRVVIRKPLVISKTALLSTRKKKVEETQENIFLML